MCQHTRTDVSEGHHTCIDCGHVLGPELTPTIQSYGHRALGPRRQHYTRMSRWKKVLSRVQGKSCGILEKALVDHLKSERPASVGECYIILKKYKHNKRPKPYESMAVLWMLCSKIRPPVLQFFEERMLLHMFTLFEFRLEQDGYSKRPPYPFLLRKFLQEPVLRMDPARVQCYLKFLPLMQCKWRLRYYQKQYDHVRRVFSGENNMTRVRKNDVEGSPRSRGVLCHAGREDCEAVADQIQRGRVQTIEAVLPTRIRRRHCNTLPPKKREAVVLQNSGAHSLDVWQTPAIVGLLACAQKWQGAR